MNFKRHNYKRSFNHQETLGRVLNICLISREYPPETGWGGIGTYTYHLAQGLADLGHQVHVISQALDSDQEYCDGDVFVHRITHPSIFLYKGRLKEFGLRLEYSYRVNQKLKELINKYRIDIVESANFSAEGFLYSFHKSTPLVTRLHTHFSEVIEFSQWPRTIDRRLSCWLENATILKSDLITCSTHRHKDLVFREIGVNGKNIEIIPLGIPLPILENKKDKNDKALTVLYVGRLERRKGVQVLFRAIPDILKQLPETKFVIIGRDTFVSKDFISFDGERKDSFKEVLIASIPKKYLQNIEFLDYLDSRDLNDYYANCDIFVAPSLYESFGFIYIEAMSYGKPVIGCSVGGVPEVIKQGIDGILVPPQDSDSLSRAITQLARDCQLRMKLGNRARERVRRDFSSKLMAENTVRAYKSLVK